VINPAGDDGFDDTVITGDLAARRQSYVDCP